MSSEWQVNWQGDSAESNLVSLLCVCVCIVTLVQLTVCEFTDLCIFLPQTIMTDLGRWNASCERLGNFIDQSCGGDAASTDVIALKKKGGGEQGRKG